MNNIEKEFVPYNLALRMKALGFDELCCAVWIHSEFLGFPKPKMSFLGQENIDEGVTKNSYDMFYACSSPTLSQAFRWFREEYEFNSFIQEVLENKYRFHIEKWEEKNYCSEKMNYEKAELACLEKLIEIIEQKNQ